MSLSGSLQTLKVHRAVLKFGTKVLAMILGLGFFGCQTQKPGSRFADDGTRSCKEAARLTDWDDAVASLNSISVFFQRRCYTETISHVDEARSRLSHKSYSIIKETLEFFIPEGKVTDYVLESYERGYLSFIAAASYLRRKEHTAVRTELHKLYNEESALTYNHGRDDVNALIQAAMWDRFATDGFSSRPFWLWLSKQKDADAKTQAFATSQINRLDAKEPPVAWRIYEVGQFPKINWEITLSDAEHGYIKMTPASPFPETCVSGADKNHLLLSTKSWFKKIARRHANSYHPLVNAKSWIRAPMGIAYGVTTIAAGAGIVVGGCALDAGTKGNGELCALSFRGGLAVAAKSGDVVDYALQPDLRHWERVPEAVFIVPDGDTAGIPPDLKLDPCLRNLGRELRRVI